MAGKPKFKPDQIIEAIRANKGKVHSAARDLKCNPRTIQNYAARFPAVREAIDDARELVSDLAESKLMELIESKNLGAIIWWLRTQAVNRGYCERPVLEVFYQRHLKPLMDQFADSLKQAIKRHADAETAKRIIEEIGEAQIRADAFARQPLLSAADLEEQEMVIRVRYED